MKKILFSLLLSVLFVSSDAQLNQVISEIVYSDDASLPGYPTGFTTYRIYALLEDPSDFLSAVYAVEGDELTIGSTTNTIWNSQFGGVDGGALNPAFFSVFPEAQWDSFVTIGRASSADPGATINVIESLPGTALDEGFGASGGAEFDSNVTLIDGGWFALNGDVNGLGVGPDNRVLLAQITTDGELEYCLNIQVFPLGDAGNAQHNTNICGSNLPSGCVDTTACNYDEYAYIDDGSCCYGECGCMDSLATNYSSIAECDDSSCLYGGCTNILACNYNPFADVDDGSCNMPDGCTDPDADNYSSSALCEDGSCQYLGCTDSLAFNFDPTANTDDGSCDYNCDFNMLTIDMFDSFGDGWNGAMWVVLDDGQNEVESGTLTTGSMGSALICLEDGCYTLTIGGGEWDMEITWDLMGSNAGTISGDAPIEQCFSVGDVECFNGCTNPVACNFDSTATCDDQSCILPGCMDTAACNFDPEATCSSGSCLYEAIIEGIVYHDADQNGEYAGDGFSEPGLFNWQIELVELGLSTYTNEAGYYQFFNVPAGSYTLTITDIAEGWGATTEVTVSVSTTTCIVENVNFGFAAEGTSPFWLSGPCCIWSMNIHCENGFNPGLWINNTGSAPLSGSVTITFDSILDAEALWGAVVPSDISPGSVTWELDGSPLGGQSLLYQCHINGPGFEYMGEQFDFNINLTLNDEGVEYYNNTWVLEPIVVCSYDPNDKYTAYEGYTEEHFILPDNSIEYRIRFQNTGNWEAEDIVITDMLDIERLDMETFQPLFGSHSYMTCVQPDGQVDFVFEDIFLPDSASNEPASQGYVVYRITPMLGIEPGEVINNTANIYFDSNPAVVTNTTWHTIMDCEPIAEFSVSSDQLCLGDVLTMETTSDYADIVNWYANDEFIGDGNIIDFTAEETGDYEIDIEVANPLCSEESTQDVTVNPHPDASFTEDGIILTASLGTSYQWYLNASPISGGTLQSYEVMETGYYSVEVTNEFNCSDLSDELMVIVNSIDDLQNVVLSIYPNPISETATLFFGEHSAAYDVRLISSSGQTVKSFENITNNKLTLNRENLASGTYVLRVLDRAKSSTKELKIVFE